MSETAKKAFKYTGELAGAYPGLGYVEPNKVIEVENPEQERIIKEAPKGMFEKFDGKVTKSNRATFPVETFIGHQKVEEVELADTPAMQAAEAPTTIQSTPTGEVKK